MKNEEEVEEGMIDDRQEKVAEEKRGDKLEN